MLVRPQDRIERNTRPGCSDERLKANTEGSGTRITCLYFIHSLPLAGRITTFPLMEDDLDFGTSVWGTTERLAISLPPASFSHPSPAPSSTQDGFDDFEEYGTPAETVAASGDEADDDFGDFGDFGEVAEVEDIPTFESDRFEDTVLTPRSSRDWHPLQLDPLPSEDNLRLQIDRILGSLWSGDDPGAFTDDPIRQVDGLNQTLVTPSRYLFSTSSRMNLHLKLQTFAVVSYMTFFYRRRSQHSDL